MTTYSGKSTHEYKQLLAFCVDLHCDTAVIYAHSVYYRKIKHYTLSFSLGQYRLLWRF